MAEKNFPQSGLPIRKTSELLPGIFQTDANDKFMSAVVDPLVQPGKLQKLTGYVGKRYGKTYNGSDTYIDTDQSLRSRYQLEPGVITKFHNEISKFYDYIDFKNQLKFFGNNQERDDLVTSQEHYSWNPPINWDKFINYREYYWEPLGPPPVSVQGQKPSVVSTYKVSLGTQSSFIFTPDGLTNNPTLTLYRGQTYKFNVNAPGEGLVFRTSYDTGSLLFNPNRAYVKGALVTYDDKLWKATADIVPGDGSSIDLNTQDWEFVESVVQTTALDYTKGVTNSGIENGTLTFEVPFDAPDVLFYQGQIDPNRFGRVIIADIESDTFIDVEKEIIGKTTYTSSNGIEFSNGLVVEFLGRVSPAKYSTDAWLIGGVGKEITLTKFSDLIVPQLSTDTPEVLFDGEGFDTQPFDDATAYPVEKDYITISRNSSDTNPWSRYNRWFHRSILEYAYSQRGQDFPADETARAKRPIIEFHANLQLFNHGSTAKQTVDYVDDYTTDVFSNIEGSKGYNIDGEELFNGARVLVIADTDDLANNKIYEVKFIEHNSRRQITLQETSDSDSILGDCVLVRRGTNNGGKMFHFDGTGWIKSQEKTKVNQPPMFDAYDSNGVSFTDSETYPTSTFIGTEILSYRTGNGPTDTELGFSLSYQNIDNIGDILFDWNWEKESFTYTIDNEILTKRIDTGYFRFNNPERFDNGWTLTSHDYLQPLLDSTKILESTNSVIFDTIDWNKVTDDNSLLIKFYLNGKPLTDTYVRNKNTFIFSNTTFNENDVVVIKVVSEYEPVNGWYEIPVGLEKNPLNTDLTMFTLGEAVDHVNTGLEFDDRFQGITPGVSNLRDLNDYQKHTKRFLKHAGLVPLTVNLLCDKDVNLIKSIQYAKKSYTEFKNNFLKKALEIEYNDNIRDLTDDIIAEITKTKTSESPFADSDMIGTGAFTKIEYKVEDVGIKTFSLSQAFNLETLSRRAVYVYRNGVQLLNGSEYTFNSTFGFITITIDIQENDEIEIREYVSTSSSYVPPTPTSMGLYKKYTPMKFVDDTYVVPREVIQGHDGSITKSYGDFRDDLLLELEYRIYNNIKEEYDYDLFDIDNVVAGYYGQGLYTKSQFDDIVSQEFLKWVQNTNINYTENEYLDTENSFTYTYSNMTDPTRTQNLPGYWRGVYRWFYDTDRPHRCPWEMLGFSEKPTWWEEEYGPAPYTKNNLLLWEDLANGIIRQGDRAGRHDRYKRSTLLDHIPTDGDGNLLSPLDSGLAQDYTLINNTGPFKLGDTGPVEYAWRSSPEWPFAVTLAMCLLKPFEFVGDSFDRSRTSLNILGQTIHTTTNKFITLNDLIIPNAGEEQVSGLVKYVVGLLKYNGMSVSDAETDIKNIDVNLSTRLSGFVDKDKQKYLLDSKNPNSSSSSIYVPAENYDIIFNVSSPISAVTYSGVILEKTEGGWTINGYDDINPWFNYYKPVESPNDPAISVGGVSENFTDWEPNKEYSNGAVVRVNNEFYRALKTFTSDEQFEKDNWKKLPNLPLVGSVTALRRRQFNRLKLYRVSYGTRLTSIQAVVDILLGYQEYLKSQGFVFDRYDPQLGASADWVTSCKEFMFWTRQNWSVGSLIALSPGAKKLDIDGPVGVADNILNGFYDYQVLKDDGKPLQPEFLNVNRQFRNITVESVNTNDGIYYLKLYYVIKEHVTVFDDRTVFNDIIYDKTTGYRQERIKTQSYRTVDWDGDYTSPGFLFDNVNIGTWQPFTDYKLGDIISYRSYNWTSLQNQLGTETFDESKWTKLDSDPEKQLIPNFDYRINQFEDYYDVTSEGINEDERKLARHAIGYQTREYLQNLAEDPVTQFQLYQGFIREKGTNNAITKVFDKLSRSGSASVELKEEWAFRTGRFGGLDQLREIEFNITKDSFVINPQPLLIADSLPSNITDRYYRLVESDFSIKPLPFTTDVNPTDYEAEPKRVAGFVKNEQVEFVVANRDDILNLDITQFSENDHIWVTFDNNFDWTVLRYNESANLHILEVTKDNDTVRIDLTKRNHGLVVGDIIGVKLVQNLTGFYKISEVGIDYISVTVDAGQGNPEIDYSSRANLYILTEARFANFESMDPRESALLPNGAKLWVSENNNQQWEVLQKESQYSGKELLEYGTTEPLNAGTKVLYDDIHKCLISSIPRSGYVMTYIESTNGMALKQIISPPSGFEGFVNNSFGREIAQSPDKQWLVIGSPLASGVTSHYKGDFDPDATYAIDDIVLFEGKLWKALNPISGDGSTLDVYTQDWTPETLVEATLDGTATGYFEQGMITLYKYTGSFWSPEYSFISPRPSDNERYGSKVTLGKDGDNYYMAVSAVGSLDNKGRVYLYKYDGTEWKHLENQNYRGVYRPSAGTFKATTTLGSKVLTGVDDFSNLEGGMIVSGANIPSGSFITSIQPNDREVIISESATLTDASITVNYGTKFYPKGSIVWHDQQLWEAQEDTFSDGSTISTLSNEWSAVDSISTQSSLPTNISLDDDGSTLALGLLSPDQLAEMIKNDDQFGTSMTMSQDGSVLVVGAPNSDGQFFTDYKGIWRSDIEYFEDQIVKHNDVYYRLTDTVLGADSTLRSYNEDPSDSSNWQEVGDSSTMPSGKIFIYKRNDNDVYEFKQSINATSLDIVSDLESGLAIAQGDQFGYAIDIDHSGTTLVVTSPKSDINFQNQGSAYIFRTDSLTNLQFRLKQNIESYERFPNEYFGESVSITSGAEKIAIGAKDSGFVNQVRFDSDLGGTTFDNNKTRLIEEKGYAGAVYVFENKGGTYLLTEKLDAVLSPFESFGSSVDITYNAIAVGSPNYRAPIAHGVDREYSTIKQGMARLFTKEHNNDPWNVIAIEEPTVDLEQIKSISLYDTENNVKIQELDYVDHGKLKILNSAEQEIRFKTIYDPAIYNVGTEEQNVIEDMAWAEKNVGKLWWNLSTAKWVYYEQDDLAFRLGNWNQLAQGASIDVYEWVESKLLPNEWAALADTNDGLALGISGQPLYPNNDVYTVKELYNPTSGAPTETLYYYWVKNSVVVPKDPARKLSAASVANLISNPAGSGVAFLALSGPNQFLAYNFDSILSVDKAFINIQYRKDKSKLNEIHNEYLLLTEGVADSVPNDKLERKWIDSLAGRDLAGNRVPDEDLPEKQRYGINFRPRQSMFIDRIPAVKSLVQNINLVLQKESFADIISFGNLNLVDQEPSSTLNLYDVSVDNYIDLENVGTTRARPAVLRANIVDGALDTIDILDSGFGYKVVPPIEFEGDGTGARATLTIDNQGQVTSATVTRRGKKYNTLIAKVRNFSVLVKTDVTARNFWSIYAWDNTRKTFFRSASQAYDTRRYWSYIDWWKEGYGITSRIVKEITQVYQEPTIECEVGDLIRIKEFANGGWAVFEKIADDNINFLDNYTIVGRENGTIEISKDLWDTTSTGIGYDNTQSFDISLYDLGNSLELRNILTAVKEDIFIGDYAVEWNKLFFSSVRYAFAEQQYIDWAFKTSFLNAKHSVGDLAQKINYRSDNLENYQDYINEVKPYHTTVREYISCYDQLENTPTAVSDFDLPATYSDQEGKIVPVTSRDLATIETYPWKFWADNYGYSVVDIKIANQGADYVQAPKVVITGDGSGAEAIAYIANGKVSGISLTNKGSGYTKAPTVTLVGGNSTGSNVAKAVAIIGDTKSRLFNLSLKFDRISKEGIYFNFTQSQTFTATGTSAVFELNYAPTRDKTKVSVTKNGQVVLSDEYNISLYTSNLDAYSILRGRITFVTVPEAGDTIVVSYEKNDELLDSVNRINKFYAPVSGMKGDDLAQLMTGIDFGGVQVQGTTFDVTGGWDALPWFTDSWDSVETTSDYYVVVDGSTTNVTLPYAPEEGQEINIYLKRANTDTTIRIDSPFFDQGDESSTGNNPNAEMPTFYGDGSTRIIEIGVYLQTEDGDTLIFRPTESDGSVTINDPNILDTAISGGTLATISSAYSTATGLSAEEITIDGSGFITPDQVPAPEENIPGQILDSLSIKVFNSTISGAAPLQSKTLITDGSTLTFDIGLDILEQQSVLVYVNKVKKNIDTDYTVNLSTNTITFTTEPAVDSVVEIISIGIGGVGLLDYQEFIADGDTTLFLTAANYSDTATVFVTVDGVYEDVGYRESTELLDVTGKTLIQFGTPPVSGSVIKIICMSANDDYDSSGLSIVRVNQQELTFDGSTRKLELDSFVDLARASAQSAVVVEVNGSALQGPDTIFFKYDGVTTAFELGQDPEEPIGAILSSNITVLINNEVAVPVQDYIYDGTTKILTVTKSLTEGDVIKIENNLRTQYSFENNDIVIDSGVALSEGDTVKVTWFSEYPSMQIMSDEFVGGKVNYKLDQTPLNASHVWVYKNGERLTKDQDYYVSLPRSVLYLNIETTVSDTIKIIMFGIDIFNLPSAFEIHKDMLNIYRFKRYSKGSVKLSRALNYYDTEILVSDSTLLSDPIPAKNVPGVVEINNERIEYMSKVGNVLSQLRRGSLGTAIKDIHEIQSDVIDLGPQETIPYNESQDKVDFTGDGSTNSFGPLEYIPEKSTRSSWYKETIPTEYGPCDTVEIFVGGKRLRKDPITVYDELLGSISPSADKTLEAEFSVDGTSPYIRFTTPPAAGTKITIIRKTGRSWYDRGETTASNGVTLLSNSTAIARFIADKTTNLPE